MVATVETISTVEEATGSYKYGFVTDIETEKAPKGLNEDIIKFISAKKNEPEWMLEWRLKAYRYWLKMDGPDWAKLDIPPIDYQDIYYYAAPKSAEAPKSLDEVDPELLATYEKLGIPLNEHARRGRLPSGRECVLLRKHTLSPASRSRCWPSGPGSNQTDTYGTDRRG